MTDQAQDHHTPVDATADPPPEPPDMFEWSVWDWTRREVATGLTDSEQRARGQVTEVMRDPAASFAAVALVDLDDGSYRLLRSIANAYRDGDGLRWEDFDT